MENQKRAAPQYWSIYKFLGLALGGLSVVKLITEGLELHSFVVPLRRLLDFYEWLIHVLLGWTEPYLRSMLHTLEGFTGWYLPLDKSWKHVFVLMMLFFSALSRDFIGRSDEVLRSSRFTSIGVWAVGIILSLATSIWLGVFPSTGPDGDPASAFLNAAMAAVPLIVISVIFLGYGAWYTRSQAKTQSTTIWKLAYNLSGIPIFLGLTLVSIVLMLLWLFGLVGNFSSDIRIFLPLLELPRPLLTGVGFVGLAVFFIAWGALNAQSWARRRNSVWFREFFFSTWTQIGFSMLIVLGEALLFLAVNAGLQQVGVE